MMTFVIKGAPDTHAREIARAGYIRVRGEINATVLDSPWYLEHRPEPASGVEAERLLARLESAVHSPLAFGYEVTSIEDESGDPQIGFDLTAAHDMFGTAISFGYLPLGEEDDFRYAKDGAAAMRGRAVRDALRDQRPLAILDPIDGTHQCAAMGQLSGYAHAVMCAIGRQKLQAAICLGDGRLVSTDGDAVWYNDLNEWNAQDDESPVQLSLKRIKSLRHYKTTLTIPAYKPNRLADAARIVATAGTGQVELLAPLSGNPGILSSVILAGAAAGYQPKSWAWDQIVMYVGAVLGLAVISVDEGLRLNPVDLGNKLIRDLALGEKTEGHVIGKTIEDAEALRKAISAAI